MANQREEFERAMTALGHDYCFDLTAAGEYRHADCFGAFDAYKAGQSAVSTQLLLVQNLLDEYGLQALELAEAFKKDPASVVSRARSSAIRDCISILDMRGSGDIMWLYQGLRDLLSKSCETPTLCKLNEQYLEKSTKPCEEQK